MLRFFIHIFTSRSDNIAVVRGFEFVLNISLITIIIIIIIIIICYICKKNNDKFKKLFCSAKKRRVGESQQPWAGVCLGPIVFFKKYERKNLEIFTWSWENDFGNLCPILIGKIGFPFKKNRPHFQETNVNFLFKVFFY